jgi:teichuronic acid biosynthesis glycosyltransferase TuaG
MKPSPFVSVIIPAYNAEKHLPTALESVINQTYRHFEVIVVDDSSRDKTWEIVCNYAKIDKRIVAIQLPTNSGGPAKPRNHGIRRAAGDCVAFLDADDIWEETKLEKQLQFMTTNALSFCSTDFLPINEIGVPIPRPLTEFIIFLLGRKKSLRDLLWHNFIVNSSVIAERRIVLNYMFDEDPLLVALEDYFLWMELMNDPEVSYGFLEEKYVRYRVSSNSITMRADKKHNKMRRNYCTIKFFVKHKMSFSLIRWYYRLFFLKYIKGLLSGSI